MGPNGPNLLMENMGAYLCMCVWMCVRVWMGVARKKRNKWWWWWFIAIFPWKKHVQSHIHHCLRHLFRSVCQRCVFLLLPTTTWQDDKWAAHSKVGERGLHDNTINCSHICCCILSCRKSSSLWPFWFVHFDVVYKSAAVHSPVSCACHARHVPQDPLQIEVARHLRPRVPASKQKGVRAKMIKEACPTGTVGLRASQLSWGKLVQGLWIFLGSEQTEQNLQKYTEISFGVQHFWKLLLYDTSHQTNLNHGQPHLQKALWWQHGWTTGPSQIWSYSETTGCSNPKDVPRCARSAGVQFNAGSMDR